MPALVIPSRRLSLCALLTLALTSLGASAQTADWPNKTVRLVVGFPAGSSPDLTARLLAEPLSKALGQSVIVDNKVGAGGNIAADYVAKATDGHTLGLMINGNMTVAGLLNPKLPYDPQKDLAPVSLIGTAPLVLAVPADAPGADAAQADALRSASAACAAASRSISALLCSPSLPMASVAASNSSMFWKVRASPRPATWWRGTLSRSWPLN
jgi:tripartite-type tricarboxylate transporter receptor subunit TctC